MPKASTLADARRLVDIPNIGPAMARDLRALGIHAPVDLKDQDPVDLYLRLCDATGRRQDPCVLDTFMAAVAFACQNDTRPWWAFTAARKQGWPAVHARLEDQAARASTGLPARR